MKNMYNLTAIAHGLVENLFESKTALTGKLYIEHLKKYHQSYIYLMEKLEQFNKL